MTLAQTKTAMIVLSDAWPLAVRVDELCDLALERAISFLPAAPTDADRHALMLDLFACVTHDVIHLHTQQLPCTNRLFDTPRANALAVYQATFGAAVVNAHHQMYKLDALGIELLRLANGKRRIGEILEELLGRFERDSIALEIDGAPITAADFRLARF